MLSVIIVSSDSADVELSTHRCLGHTFASADKLAASSVAKAYMLTVLRQEMHERDHEVIMRLSTYCLVKRISG